MNFLTHNNILQQMLCVAAVALAIAFPLQAANPLEGKTDGSWISLSGKVVSHTPKVFTLDYGKGTITVETDDWDSIGDGWAIKEGDNVTVYGRVDDAFYHNKMIEAGSVYIKDTNTLVTAPSSADEEKPVSVNYMYVSTPTDANMHITGTVTSVSGREFTLDTGKRRLIVDTLQMDYNPMDNIGLQRVKVGDFVSVSGDLDVRLFDKNLLTAKSIVSYH